jgi:hypothetical protein
MVDLNKVLILIPGVLVLNFVRITISQRRVTCVEDYLTDILPAPDTSILFFLELLCKLLTDLAFLAMLLLQVARTKSNRYFEQKGSSTRSRSSTR